MIKKAMNILCKTVMFASLVAAISIGFGVNPVKAVNDGFQYVAQLQVGTAQYPTSAGTTGNVMTSNGTNWTSAATASGLPNGPFINGFRLTGTTGVAVTSSDVSNITTIYFTPYTGNAISVFDGVSTWSVITSAEISIALGTLTTSVPYDVFVYNNAGTLTIDTLVAWTNTTTRATAIVLQNGVYVKSGATTRLYVGTFYMTSTTQTQDTLRQRLIFNQYNFVPRGMSRVDTTDSWTYTSSTFRESNGSTINQLEVVIGTAGRPVKVTTTSQSSSTLANRYSGIGINSTSVNSATTSGYMEVLSAGTDQGLSHYTGNPAIGFNYYAWLEASDATGTTTWIGDAGLVGLVQNGMVGETQQ